MAYKNKGDKFFLLQSAFQCSNIFNFSFRAFAANIQTQFFFASLRLCGEEGTDLWLYAA